MSPGRAAKWILVSVGMTAAAALSFLFTIGVPKPNSISADGVGRVGWASVLDDWSWVERSKSQTIVAPLPDGSGILVRGAHRLLDSRVFLLNEPGGTPRLVAALPSQTGAVHWGPAARYLVTSWDQDGNEQIQLFRVDLDGLVTTLTSSQERAQFGDAEPGGRRIAYTSNRRNGRDFDVYVVDPLDPDSEERVIELEGAWTVVDWSPTGNQLLLAKAFGNTSNQLHVLTLDTRTVQPLTRSDAQHAAARWTSDGSAILYASNRDTEFLQLRRLDLQTGAETVLSAHIPWDVSGIDESPDGARLLVAVNEGGWERYYLTDGVGGDFELFDPAPPGTFTAKFHPAEPQVLINHSDARGIGRGFVYHLDSGKLVRWAGPEVASGDAPKVELFHYPTFDQVGGEQRRIPAFLYPGVGGDAQPVLISIHGGPEAQVRPSRRWRATQKQGITVITPNVRGSTGYGVSYEKLDDGLLRENAVRDIGALLDWIAAHPGLDENRVAVTGGSYGGYMVLASLVHHGDRILCGIDRVGISNFVTFLENTADYRRDLRRAEYGDERIPEMRDFLHSISPLTNADQITSQLLVVQGANDPRVPVTEARQLVEKTSANGQDVGYIEAADEGHGFRKPWNSFYTQAAEQQMLRECLAPN